MTLKIRQIVIDCADPYLLAAFWSQATGYREQPDSPNHPEDPEALLATPDGWHRLLFVRVPEAKRSKNRVHLDLAPTDRTRDEEIDRLVSLGATLLADHRQSNGPGWAVLVDPEGNEFCVERSAAERAAHPTA